MTFSRKSYRCLAGGVREILKDFARFGAVLVLLKKK